MSRRNFLLAALGVAFLALAGCGDSEGDQAKAFADFLDHRVLEKPGLHVPKLTDKERTSFGRFAQDYDVLLGFQADLDAVVKDYAKPGRVPTNASIGDLAKLKPDIVAAREFLTRIGGALDGALTRAQTATAALKQPDQLKSHFDQAFERTVVAPHKVMHEVIPPTVEILDAELAVADYMSAHQADIVASGVQVQVSKPEVLAALQKLMNAYNAKASQAMEARRKLLALAQGS